MKSLATEVNRFMTFKWSEDFVYNEVLSFWLTEISLVLSWCLMTHSLHPCLKQREIILSWSPFKYFLFEGLLKRLQRQILGLEVAIYV